MNRIILTVFLTLIGVTSYSQTYQELIARAEAQYYNQEYKEAGKTYDQALKLKKDKAQTTDIYNAACSWSLAGKEKKALKRLESAIEAGYWELDWMKKDKDLENIRDSKKWAQLTNDLEKKIAAFEAGLNKPLIAELREIAEKDQRYRKLMDSIGQQFGWESDEMKTLWDKQNKLDSLNTIRITEIIEEYGYPGRSLVGSRQGTAFIVIQHADLVTQEKYLPILKKAADAGELRWSSLALLIDRVRLRNGQSQLYGTQIGRDPETGKFYVADIEDEANVNKRREEAGLGPLEDYAKRWNIDYKLPKDDQ